MPGITAMGVFCEDIREEKTGTQTLVGVYPDNLNIPTVPAALPKLALYMRIAVDPFVDAEQMSVWLISPKGDERKINDIDTKLVAQTQANSRKSGTPFATMISRIIAPAFPVTEYGRMKALLRIGSEEIICATLNFQVPPASPSSNEPRRPAKRSRAAAKKKAKKRATSRP